MVETLARWPEQVQAALVAPGRPDPLVAEALGRCGIEADPRPGPELDRLSGGGNHQGVVLVVGPYPYLPLEDLLARASGRLPLCVLDQVQDPRNLGAILRSAYVLGCDGVVIPERRAVAVTPTVVRTSAGASEHVPVSRVTNLVRALAALREAGWWTVGAVGDGGVPPEAVPWLDHAVLVLGSEGAGLRRSVLEACDFRVTIPMEAPLTLNVSVAAGVLFAEAARQRRAAASASARP